MPAPKPLPPSSEDRLNALTWGLVVGATAVVVAALLWLAVLLMTSPQPLH